MPQTTTMTHRLFIFNPDHEEALAEGSPTGNPGKAARMMAANAWSLPGLLAEKGDYVVCPAKAVFRERAHNGLGLKTTDLTTDVWDDIGEICPWGWDGRLVKQLSRLGAPQRLLPDEEAIDRLRRLSSRQTVGTVLERLKADVPEVCGESLWCTTFDEVVAALADIDGQAVAKVPWSCSGRGVFRVSRHPDKAQSARIGRILERQGGIEIQPFYCAGLNFAMEFELRQGRADYLGMSVFSSLPGGQYSGSLVAPESRLRALFPPTVVPTAERVKDALLSLLPTLLCGIPDGPLGIDMMVCETADGELRLNPCIELNLRRTMGHVAIALTDRLDTKGLGLFSFKHISALTTDDGNLTPEATDFAAVWTKLQTERECWWYA